MPRLFTEAEAQKVFARVAERQRAAGLPAAGLSLADLEEAARAAGLDAGLVASAAADLDAPAHTRTLLGAPTEVVAQRTLAGAVSDEAWEAMVAAARAEFGRAGIAGQIGRTREWTVVGASNNAQPTTRLALEPAPGGTRIVLSQSVRDAALGITIAGSITVVMGILFTALAMAGVDPELWIATLILAVMSVLFLGGSQVALRLWQRRQDGRFERLLDRLELAARADSHAPDVHAPDVHAPAGRIRPDLLGDDVPDPDGSVPPTHRTRT